MGQLQIDGSVRTLQLNLDMLREFHVLAFDVNGNFFRIAAHDTEVSIVQVQTKVSTAGKVRFKFLMLEIRSFLYALAESH